jgi:RNA polymerase sigma-70 factor (ECF subfamily)
LLSFIDTPVIRLNSAVARAMTGDLSGAREQMASLAQTGQLDGYHLLPAAQAEVARRMGQTAQALALYQDALKLTDNLGERKFIERRMTEVAR